jgi:hypothetical protein
MPLTPEQPFYRTRTDEERAQDTRKTFTISLNEQEQKELEEVKLAWDIKSDGLALKLMFEAGKNVFFRSLDLKTWQYLTREKRKRYSEFKDIDAKLKENVLQDFQES